MIRAIQTRFYWRWTLKLLLAIVFLASITIGFDYFDNNTVKTFTAPIVNAQTGGDGQDPTDKVNAIDFYPDPLSEGALAFSLRDPWDHTDLTFFFHNCPARFDCQESREAVRQGFNTWAFISALTFVEVNSVGDADIEVRWVDSQSDPEGELGQVGGTLAYAYFPRFGGDMYIDDTEPWTLGDGGEFDLIVTATHEIGHSVGLGHSEFTSAIMYPYSGYAFEIGPDDVAAIQSLYGPPSGTTPPATQDDDINGDTPTRNIPTDQEDITVDGTISDENPFEVWEITADTGQTVTVTMNRTSGDLDAYIGILDTNLADVLAENDDFTNSRDARLTYTFDQAGTYNVVATRFGFEDGTTSGTYLLRVEFGTGGTPTDPNETVEPESGTIVWRISNFADTDLCYIYFSPSSNDTWGPDQLGAEQVLNDNFFLEWEVDRNTYDLQVWDCFENKLERYNIRAERDINIQVYADSIEVVPLGEQTTVPSQPDTYRWRVSNYAGTALCYVYFSQTTDDQWGPDQLGDSVLEENTYFEWELVPATYDLQVWDCQENNLELRDITLQRDTELQVYNDRILIVPLN